MQNYTDYDEKTMRLIPPVHDELTYCGRIDVSNPDAPVFVQPGSFVRVSFTGSSWIRAVVINRRSYYDSWVGVLADRNQYRVKIEKDDEPVVLTLAEKQVQTFTAMFSWPQLITALIGGALALVVVPLLKKAQK